MSVARELLYADRRGVEFLIEFRDDLVRTISYHFLTENSYGTDADSATAAAAADILALICEHYEIPPGVNVTGVRQWRMAFDRYMDKYHGANYLTDPNYEGYFRERRQIVEAVLVRLEAIAQRYDHGVYDPSADDADWTPDKE